MAKLIGKQKIVTVEIRQDLSLKNIGKTTDLLLHKTEGSSKIVLKLIDMENIDLAGVQLIYSLQKYISDKNIQFELKPEINQETIALLEKAGFKDIFEQHT